jgi:hypothetical protein
MKPRDKAYRVYADTSVFGGCFEEGVRDASRGFFDLVKRGRFILILSDTTLLELRGAPKRVRDVLTSLPPEFVERISLSEEIEELRDAYLSAEVVGPSCVEDAEHIASATVAEADFVVSWNFKHIVHVEKISGFQGVNLLKGYPPLRIFSPLEVI